MGTIDGREMPEDSPEKPFVVQIGQDVLAHLVFTQDGPNRSFSLTTQESQVRRGGIYVLSRLLGGVVNLRISVS